MLPLHHRLVTERELRLKRPEKLLSPALGRGGTLFYYRGKSLLYCLFKVVAAATYMCGRPL